MNPNYAPKIFEDSQRPEPHTLHARTPAPCKDPLLVTVILRPEAKVAAYTELERFAGLHHLSVQESDIDAHRVQLAGTVEDMQEAFNVVLEHVTVEGKTYRSRSEYLSVPDVLHSEIVAVLGLANPPVAKPHFRKMAAVAEPDAAGPQPLYATQVAKAYGFPTDVTGKGQMIGIIELGGGFTQKDLKTYFEKIGIPEPKVVAVSVDGGRNDPSDRDASGEVVLDIETCGAVAPGAKISVYCSPNTDQGFVDAILQAIKDKVTVISISWGSAEPNWTKMSINAMNQALQMAATAGITVCVAAGDNGASDGESDSYFVDFPASSPYSLACGGTTLVLKNGIWKSETTWNDSQDSASGGGTSREFPLPAYQQGISGIFKSPQVGFSGRTIPDIAANADPNSGYLTYLEGEWTPIGGTSAVSPLTSGLIALINEKAGKSVGFINPILYKNGATMCRDIKTGDNRHYHAVAGFDEATGWGSPLGAEWEKVLAGGI